MARKNHTSRATQIQSTSLSNSILDSTLHSEFCICIPIPVLRCTSRHLDDYVSHHDVHDFSQQTFSRKMAKQRTLCQ